MPVANQPQDTIAALAEAEDPQRWWVAQVRQQRQVRNASRRHFRISMVVQISVVKHAQPWSLEDTTALGMEPQREIDFFHSVRHRQRDVALCGEECCSSIDAGPTGKIRNPFGSLGIQRQILPTVINRSAEYG